MRILHVVKKLPPLLGGDATVVDALTRAQERVGHRVEVLVYDAEGLEDRAGRHRVGPTQRPEDLDRINVRRIRALLGMRRWAKSHLPMDRPEVVHAHAPDVGAAVAPVARRLGVPAVLTCHGVWFPTKGRFSPSGRIERWLLRHGRYSVMTAVDRGSVEALRSVGFPDVRLVPNGVDLREFEGPALKEGPFRFLFAGRHEPQKGLDILLSAVARARDLLEGPFLLELAGEGSLTSRLRDESKALGLDGVVRFLGPLSRRDLVASFRRADVFVLPSRFEGFPVAILEAWAAGLPVVATAVGGIPDICTPETAILVRKEDPEALAQAMADLFQDSGKRASLGESGRRVAAERFSWDAIAREYERVYRRAGDLP